MRTAGKFICLTFFEYESYDEGKSRERRVETWRKGQGLKILGVRRRPPPSSLSPSRKSWSSHMENTEDFPWSAYSNDFEKSVREHIISKQQIYRK